MSSAISAALRDPDPASSRVPSSSSARLLSLENASCTMPLAVLRTGMSMPALLLKILCGVRRSVV